jgi:prepilin-type N-terminal cleavage/methylation domain-containing protein
MERLQRDPLRSARAFTLLELLVVIGIIVIVASLVLAVSSSVIRSSEERSTRNTLEVLNMATEEYERTIDRRITYKSGAVPGGVVADNPPTGQTWNFDVLSSQTSTTIAQEKPPIASGVTGGWTSLAAPYNGVSNGLPAFSTLPFRRTAQLLWLLSESPSSGAILQKLPEAVFRGIKPNANTNSFTALRHAIDAWDTPIIAIFPGREASASELSANNANVVDKDGTIKCDSEWAAPGTGGMQVSCKDRKILWMSAGNDSRYTVQSGTAYSISNDNLYSYDP